MTGALRYLVPLLLAIGPLTAQPLKYAPYQTGQILLKPKLTASSPLLQALHPNYAQQVKRPCPARQQRRVTRQQSGFTEPFRPMMNLLSALFCAGQPRRA
jgi:hypothetical protein